MVCTTASKYVKKGYNMNSAQFKDETGKRYNKLTVLNRVGSDSSRLATFLCKCDCGNTTVVRGRSLRDGHTKSCGCIKKTINRKKKYEASFNAVFSRIKTSAKKRNYYFDISKDDFKKLSKQNCVYCGVKPLQSHTNMPNGNYVYNGLDRVDNTKGYTLDNVVPCCGICNRAKDTMSVEEFYNMIKKIYLRGEYRGLYYS